MSQRQVTIAPGETFTLRRRGPLLPAAARDGSSWDRWTGSDRGR